MRICCVSDLHGELPKIPYGVNVVLIGGDLSPSGPPLIQLAWLNSHFRTWLDDLKERNIAVVGIAGNHDTIFQDSPQLVPELPWTYLQDSSCIVQGLRIWGTPWSLPYGKWAFMRDEEFLKTRYDMISQADVIISHGPPYGYGDECPSKGYDWTHEGSKSLLDAIDRVKPKIVIFGHIHQGFGIYSRNDIILCNAALWNHVTDTYREPHVIDFD